MENCSKPPFLSDLQASLVSEVKSNLQELVEDWHLFQHELQADALQNPAGAAPVATGKGDQQQVYRVVWLMCMVTIVCG